MLNYCKGNEFDLHKNTQLLLILTLKVLPCLDNFVQTTSDKIRHVSSFFYLTANQVLFLLLDRRLKPNQTPEHKRGLIFRAPPVARRDYTAILRQQKLLSFDAFRVLSRSGRKRFGKYFFPCIFCQFQSQFDII